MLFCIDIHICTYIYRKEAQQEHEKEKEKISKKTTKCPSENHRFFYNGMHIIHVSIRKYIYKFMYVQKQNHIYLSICIAYE